jgi:periplasmic divalent cation tolerance protein
MNKTRLIYATAPSHDEAGRIAETVVRERLAACANLFDGVTSFFHWDGQLCRENETVLILKTAAQRVDELTERIRQLHSYDCPCIVSIPIEAGNPGFLNWIEQSTGPENGPLPDK